MRQILVEYARIQITGGGTRIAQVGISGADQLTDKASEEVLRLHQALMKLARHDARKENVVELRYFGGYTFDEIAKILEVAKTTVERDWKFARSWLSNEISGLEDLKSTES
jgi:RNA polymerase sigma factor (TIGR02999 family)